MDPLLDARKVAGLGRCCNACSNGIQIHISHTCRNRCFVEQDLCTESTFPKSPGKLVFLISSTSDRFGQTTHEPGNILQSATFFFQPAGVIANSIEFEFRGFRRKSIFGSALGKQSPPPQSDLVIGPSFHNIRPGSDDDMKMIAEHGKAKDIQRKDPSQFLQSFSNPLFAVGVIISGSTVPPAEKCATYASIHQMKRLNLLLRTNLRSLHPRHRSIPLPKTDISRGPARDHSGRNLIPDDSSCNKVGGTLIRH